MSKARRAATRDEQSDTRTAQRVIKWWKRASLGFLVATVAVPLAAYETGLKNIVEPWVKDAFAWAEDQMSPMPDDKLIGISLRFWDPSDQDRRETFEGLSITVGPKQCRQPGGYALTRIFADHGFNANTHAFVRVTCRASGRVTVTLIPRSGAAATVYDGRAKEWEQLPFPGVSGSYSYGDVVVTMLNRDLPAGPMRPINKCQVTNNC